MLRPAVTALIRGSDHSRPASMLALSGALLAILIAGAAAFLIVDIRDWTVADNERALTSLSTILADQADRAFQAIDLTQQAIIEEIRGAEVSTEAEYMEFASRRAMHDAIRARITSLPQVNAVTLIDHRGKLLNFSRYWPIPDVDISDRDYFQALVADPALQRFVSRPVPNRGDGTWTIYIARKLLSADDQFLGLVLGAVELRYFEQLYSEITPSSGYVVSMFRTDGVLLARHPPRPGTIGQAFPSAGASLVSASGATDGVLRTVSPIDGQDRLISARTLAHYPLLLSVSRTVASSLASWRRQAFLLGGAALLLDFGVLGVVLLGIRRVRMEQALARADAARIAAEGREWSERALRQQDVRFATALDNMTQGLCMFDDASRLLVVNRQIAGIFGLRNLPDLGSGLNSVLRGVALASGMSRKDVRRAGVGIRGLIGATLPAGLNWDLEDGRSLSVRFRPTPAGGWLLTCEDVTQRRRAEKRATFLAHHDALTTLPNRVLFRERLAQTFRHLGRNAGFAVLFVDLDHFKEINDAFGHLAGDQVLHQTGERLMRCVREGDTVSRLGSDEFAILQAGLADGEAAGAAMAMALRLIEELSLPFDLEGSPVVVGASIGIALAQADGGEPEQLMQEASVALHGAKEDGRGCLRFFEPEMNHRLQVRRALEAELRQALEKDEFEVFYQPLLRVTDQRIVGFEALLRWRHPEHGLVSPGDFIPLAEELGLIVPIGEWVLGTACAEAMSWPGELRVAVNLSPVQVRSPGLVQMVSSALLSSGLKADRLELEITETMLLQDTAETLDTLRLLHELGVAIAMDDFGTGYSSLGYLRKFPFHKVKIDRSFVQDLGRSAEAAAIVRAVTGLCVELGMVTLAEGVENEQQLAILREERCLEVQGFLFSPPRPAAAIPALLAEFAGTPPGKAALQRL